MRFCLVFFIALTGLASCAQEMESSDSLHEDKPILGALDKSVIDAEVKGVRAQVKQCFEEGLQMDPSIEGRINIKMVIGSDGLVTRVETAEGTLDAPDVEECIHDQIWTLEFPPPEGGGIVIVNYPFVLSGG